MRKMLRLGEDRADRVVDRVGARAVVADRLFHDDARARRRQPALRRGAWRSGRTDPARWRDNRRGRARPGRAAPSDSSQPASPSRRPRHSRCAAGSDRAPRPARRRRGPNLTSASFTRGAEGVAIERAARDADDARGLGELIAHFAVKQRGIEFAIGEIAGAAEDDEIERIDLDDSRRHGVSRMMVSTGRCERDAFRTSARIAAPPRRSAEARSREVSPTRSARP